MLKFLLPLVLLISLVPVNAHAQTMDVAQIVTQLLSQYQNQLEGEEVTDSLQQTGEMSKISGAMGQISKLKEMKDKATKLLGNTKFATLVDNGLTGKLDDLGAIKDYSNKNFFASSDSKQSQLEMVKQIREKTNIERHVGAVEAYGKGVAMRKQAEKLEANQDEMSSDASDANDMRQNIQSLSSMMLQVQKQVSDIQTLDASLLRMKSVSSMEGLGGRENVEKE